MATGKRVRRAPRGIGPPRVILSPVMAFIQEDGAPSGMSKRVSCHTSSPKGYCPCFMMEVRNRGAMLTAQSFW